MPITRREFLKETGKKGAVVGGTFLLSPLVNVCDFFFPKSQEEESDEHIEKLYKNFDTLHDPNYWIGKSMVSSAEVEGIFRNMFFNPSEALKKALGAKENEYATFVKIAKDTVNAFGKLSAGMKALDIQLMYADRAKNIAEFRDAKWVYKHPFKQMWEYRNSDFARFEGLVSVVKGDLSRAAAFGSNNDYLASMFNTSRAFIVDDLEYVRRRRKEKPTEKGSAKGSDISEPPNPNIKPAYADILRVRIFNYREPAKLLDNIVFEITTKDNIPEKGANVVNYRIELETSKEMGIPLNPDAIFSDNISVDTVLDISNKKTIFYASRSQGFISIINGTRRDISLKTPGLTDRMCELYGNICFYGLEHLLNVNKNTIAVGVGNNNILKGFSWRAFSYSPEGVVIDRLPSSGYGTFKVK